MSSVENPAPPGMHGLLTLRRGTRTFAKKQRRLANLENGVLTLRPSADAQPDTQLTVFGAHVSVDASSHSLTLTTTAGNRLRLSAHSRLKFSLWVRALSASAIWIPSTYYDFVDGKGKGVVDVPHAAVLATFLVDGVHRKSGKSVTICSLSLSSSSSSSNCKYATRTLAHAARIARLCSSTSGCSPSSIVAVRDVFETSQQVHVVYCTKLRHSLQCVINLSKRSGRRRSISEHNVANIMFSLLSALAQLHACSVVHRGVCLRALSVPDVAMNDGDEWKGQGVALGECMAATLTTKRFSDTSGSDLHNGGGERKTTTTGRVKRFSGYIQTPTSMAGSYAPVMGGQGSACCGGSADKACGENAPFTTPLHLGTVGPCAEAKEKDKENVKPGLGVLASGGIDRLTVMDVVSAPAYAAPEQVRLERYGSPVDVWASGVILAQLLGASLPRGSTDREVMQCVADGSFTSEVRRELEAAGASKGVTSFVGALMKEDGRRRLTAEAALRNEWLLRQCQL